jgi:hypothetical protein
MTATEGLRERQAAVVRVAILDALASRLDHEDPTNRCHARRVTRRDPASPE